MGKDFIYMLENDMCFPNIDYIKDDEKIFDIYCRIKIGKSCYNLGIFLSSMQVMHAIILVPVVLYFLHDIFQRKILHRNVIFLK